MKVEGISYHGIREIYEQYTGLYEEPSARIMKETTSSDRLASMVHIYINLSEVTPIDAFMLRRLIGKDVTFGYPEMLMLDDFMSLYVPEGVEDEGLKSLETLYNRSISIGNQLNNDADVPKTAVSMLQFPLMYVCTATVHITGRDIYGIYGKSSFFDIFQTWLNGGKAMFLPGDEAKGEERLDHKVESIGYYTNPENGMIIYRFPDTQEVFDSEISLNRPEISFDDFTIQSFFNTFYSFYNQKLSSIDLVADSYLHNRYLSTPQSYNEIITPYATINMKGDPEFAEKMQIIKTAYAEDPDFRMNFDDQVRYSVTVRSSFGAFLRLWMEFPTTVDPSNMIITWEDLKIILERDEYTDMDRLKKFRRRLTDSTQMVKDTIGKIGKANRIIKFNVIPYGVPINYVISGTVNEMENLCSSLDKINESSYFESFFDISDKTIKKINRSGNQLESLSGNQLESLSGNQLESLSSYIRSFGCILAKNFKN